MILEPQRESWDHYVPNMGMRKSFLPQPNKKNIIDPIRKYQIKTIQISKKNPIIEKQNIKNIQIRHIKLPIQRKLTKKK